MRDAIIVQIISWIAQFLGHGLAEGRAPALLDNIVGGRFIDQVHNIDVGC
jgi:uncharacterized membrane protein YGL010W